MRREAGLPAARDRPPLEYHTEHGTCRFFGEIPTGSPRQNIYRWQPIGIRPLEPNGPSPQASPLVWVLTVLQTSSN